MNAPGPVRPWRRLVADPVWRRWTVVGAATRLPVAMAPLALVLVGQAATGSYRLGAAMAASFTVAEAVGAPVVGRLLGRGRDLRVGLGASLGLAVALFAGLALAGPAGAPATVLLVLSAVAGGVPAGVQGGVRALLPRLVPAELHDHAFAVDASLLEVEWMAAPALVSLTVMVEPAAAAATMAVAAGAGVVAVSTLPSNGSYASEQGRVSDDAAGPRGDPGLVPAWRAPAARGAYAASVLLGFAEGTVTLSVPALLPAVGGRAGSAGFVLVALAASSTIGGLVWSRRSAPVPGDRDRRAPALLAVLGLCCVPVALAGSVVALVVAVAAFGFLVAPINAVRSGQLATALPQSQQPEGFSILYALNGAGFGVAGAVVAVVGPGRAPYAIAFAAAVTTLAGVGQLAGARAPRAGGRPAGRADR